MILSKNKIFFIFYIIHHALSFVTDFFSNLKPDVEIKGKKYYNANLKGDK
jgi:hypothetical protein